jgi:hypothetical protein
MQNLSVAIRNAINVTDEHKIADIKLAACVTSELAWHILMCHLLSSHLDQLHEYSEQSQSEDTLFSLVNYHRFRTWLVSVRCIALPTARLWNGGL